MLDDKTPEAQGSWEGKGRGQQSWKRPTQFGDKNRSTETADREKCSPCAQVVSNSAMPWTVARQASLCMEFSRPEYWSGLPFPTPGDLPDPGLKPMSLESLSLAGRFFTMSWSRNRAEPQWLSESPCFYKPLRYLDYLLSQQNQTYPN